MMERTEFLRVTPEEEGISSRSIEAFVDALEDSGAEMHGLMILRRGRVLAEGWWSPYGPGIVHGLQSLSKSYASTAVRLAADRGLVHLEDRMADLFPEYLPESPSEYLTEMTVRHVLSMSCGMTEMPDMGAQNWIREFFATPVVHKPGTAFFYNSIGSSMLCAVVRKVTGQSVLAFLKANLFDIIGIDSRRVKWLTHSDGTENGGGGFFSTTEDNARLAQLYLQKGVWEGRRVLSEHWVAEATRMQMHSYEDPGIPDCKLGYGFQMWMCRPGEGTFRFDGAYGQYAVVVPKLELVVAVNETARLGAGAQKTLDIVWDVLLPHVGTAPLPADPQSAGHLRRRMESLSLPKPPCRPFAPFREKADGRDYLFSPCPATVLPKIYLRMTGQTIGLARGFRLDFMPAECRLIWRENNGEICLRLGMDGQPRLNEGATDRIITGRISGAADWRTDDLLAVTLRYVETCFTKEIRFHFCGRDVNVEVDDGQPDIGRAEDDTVVRLKGKAIS